MFIHFYYSLVPNSGDIRRIKNINKELSDFYGTNSIEVCFYGFKDRKIIKKWGKFKVNDSSYKKFYVFQPPKVHWYFPWFQSFIIAIIGMIYHVDLAVGEMIFPYKFKEFFKFFNPKSKIFVDIHGARVEELISIQPDTDVRQIEAERERESYSVDKASYVICQSDEMKKYIVTEYGQDSEKILVYRCGYDSTLFSYSSEARKITREELKLTDNDILFVYAGGMHKWQKIEDSLAVFNSYHVVNSNSKFLILTGDQEELRNILESEKYSGIKDSIISFSVPFSSVSKYLSAADIAFLIRDNHKMNAVASPTKLAEYLACGLPIITSEVAKCWVSEQGLPFLLFIEKGDVNDRIKTIIKHVNKKEIEEYALNNLSLEIDRRTIESFLRALR